MTAKITLTPSRLHRLFRCCAATGALCLAACTTLPPNNAASSGQEPTARAYADEGEISRLLEYFRLLQRMTPAELLRERSSLLAGAHTATGQIRLAMLQGQPRTTTDLVKAQALLDNVLRSSSPEAASLHPLARILAVNFQERQKLDTQNDKLTQQLKASEMQNDRLAQQLKASQQHTDELQEKLDALANIERSLPVRPATGNSRPTPRQ